MTEIILEKQILADGKWQIDLIASDLPEQFLGLAGDLQLHGDWTKTEYLGMEWAESIEVLPVEQQPIKMVKALPEDGLVVMGMTFKAGNLPKLNDGKLASLVFKGDTLDLVKLDNTVLSVYRDGRQDWKAVKWVIADKQAEKIGVDPVAKQEVSQLSSIGSDQLGENLADTPEIIDGATPVETDLNQVALTELVNSPQPANQSGDFGWWWLILLIAVPLVVGASGWGLWQAYRRTKPALGLKGDFRASAKADFA